jgi:hypothetical protein
MRVVNSWPGRIICSPLVMILIATSCQASTLINFPAKSLAPLRISSHQTLGNSGDPAYEGADSVAPASGQSQQSASSPATSQTPPDDPAQTQSNQFQPQQIQTPDIQSIPPNAQTSPAPVVPTPASPPVDSRSAPMPPAPQPSQQTAPGTNQPYTGDQQYSTPAATQQLNRRPLNGQPVATPASEPTAPASPPVGTALAPAIRARGTAGSRVAGAAVAPAKQRRIRTFAIRAALLAGAAVAIGVVVAASKASPARAQ